MVWRSKVALKKNTKGQLRKLLDNPYKPITSPNPTILTYDELVGMDGEGLILFYKSLCKFVIELDKIDWHVRVAPNLLYANVLALVDSVYTLATEDEKNILKKLAFLTSAHFEKKEYLRLDNQVKAHMYAAKRKDLTFSMVKYDKPYDFIRLVLEKK